MSTAEIRGPVELAVIRFPGSRFNREIVPAPAELQQQGILGGAELTAAKAKLLGT